MFRVQAPGEKRHNAVDLSAYLEKHFPLLQLKPGSLCQKNLSAAPNNEDITDLCFGALNSPRSLSSAVSWC